MSVQQRLADGPQRLAQLRGVQRQLGHPLGNQRVLHRLRGVISPAEHPMERHQHCGNLAIVPAVRRKGFGYHLPGGALVFPCNFLPAKRPGTGDGAPEMIGVRGPQRRNLPPGLRKRRGAARMGVHHASDFRKAPVQHQVRGRVGGRGELPLGHRAVGQTHHHHILRPHPLIGYPRGLDDHQPPRTVDSRNIPPGQRHQPVLPQRKIGRADLCLQLLQHLFSPNLLTNRFFVV